LIRQQRYQQLSEAGKKRLGASLPATSFDRRTAAPPILPVAEHLMQESLAPQAWHGNVESMAGGVPEQSAFANTQ
jgi:hypothetical protein